MRAINASYQGWQRVDRHLPLVRICSSTAFGLNQVLAETELFTHYKEDTHPLSKRAPIFVQVLFKIEKRLKSKPPLSSCPRADASWNLVGEGNTPIAFDAAAS